MNFSFSSNPLENPFSSSPFGTTTRSESGSEEQPIIEIQHKKSLLSPNATKIITEGLKEAVMEPLHSLVDDYENDLKEQRDIINEMKDRLLAMRIFMYRYGLDHKYEEFLKEQIREKKITDKPLSIIYEHGLKDVELMHD